VIVRTVGRVPFTEFHHILKKSRCIFSQKLEKRTQVRLAQTYTHIHAKVCLAGQRTY